MSNKSIREKSRLFAFEPPLFNKPVTLLDSQKLPPKQFIRALSFVWQQRTLTNLILSKESIENHDREAITAYRNRNLRAVRHVLASKRKNRQPIYLQIGALFHIQATFA